MLQNTVPDKLEVGVESLIQKICNEFSGPVIQRADLQLQFKANQMQRKQLLKHVAMKFLFFDPVVKRVLI